MQNENRTPSSEANGLIEKGLTGAANLQQMPRRKSIDTVGSKPMIGGTNQISPRVEREQGNFIEHTIFEQKFLPPKIFQNNFSLIF